MEFERCYSCLGEWLTQAEEKIMHEAYGSTLDEVASFRAALEVRVEFCGWSLIPLCILL